MKFKLLVAVLLTFVLLFGGLLHDFYIKHVFTEMSDAILKIENVSDNNYNLDAVNEALHIWRKHSKILISILPHNNLFEIEYIFGEIIGALEAKDLKSATAQINRLKHACLIISNMFIFNMENLL
ncbi:MAG: DUF4363 family protein [Christensenellaceae bacterium]|jgi:hypothetical protein|nr:DUF4363 family protein [Christensenellaceae bacterium]